MKKFFILLVAFLAFTGISFAQDQAEDLDLTYGTELLKKGAQAPDFSLPGLDGKTYTLKDFAGKTVIIDFWATWCPDCREEMPQLLAFYKKLKNRDDVVFLGISFDTDKQQLQDYVKENGIGWMQLCEGKKWKETTVSDNYHIKWIPTKYVIGPDGKVILATVMPDKVEALFK